MEQATKIVRETREKAYWADFISETVAIVHDRERKQKRTVSWWRECVVMFHRKVELQYKTCHEWRHIPIRVMLSAFRACCVHSNQKKLSMYASEKPA